MALEIDFSLSDFFFFSLDVMKIIFLVFQKIFFKFLTILKATQPYSFYNLEEIFYISNPPSAWVPSVVVIN